MKHVTDVALERLADLIREIRARPGLKEKKSGIFYRKSNSFLHFHEDPGGLFADLRTEAGFDRYPVNNRHQWKMLLSAIDRALNL